MRCTSEVVDENSCGIDPNGCVFARKLALLKV
jgi:hypothetical protein